MWSTEMTSQTEAAPDSLGNATHAVGCRCLGLAQHTAVIAVEGSSVLVPDFIGNVLVGAIAALISWCHYGPFPDRSLIKSSDPWGATSMREVGLPLAALAGAILVGFSGGRWITAEDERRLNHGTAVLPAQAAEQASAVNRIPSEGTATGGGQAGGVSKTLSQALLTESPLQAYRAAQQMSSAAPGGAVHSVWIGTHEWLTAGVVRPSESPFFPLARIGPTHAWRKLNRKSL
jgi:hypothetical protein